jgi:branched-chain amino acid transport system permease protein
MSPRARLAGLALVALVAIAVPFLFGSFRVGQFTQVLAYSVAILGLNLLVGYSGQISLGHGAFFALGAYAAAILIADHGFPHLLTVPIAGAFAFVAGLLVGLPALRVRGLYLALLTLGLAVAAPPVIKRLEGLTGGAQGLNVALPEAGGGLAQDQWIYFVSLAVVVVLFALIAFMLRGRVGRALITIRDDEIVARSMGINLALYKTAAFAISAAYAGMGGALYVFTVGFVSPESFTLTLSIGFLAAVVVGGLATVSGAVLGALFIVLVPEYAADVDEALAGVIYGTVLIVFMYLERGGIVGIARRVARGLRLAGTDNNKGRREAHAEVTGDAAPGAAGDGAGAGRGGVRTR